MLLNLHPALARRVLVGAHTRDLFDPQPVERGRSHVAVAVSASGRPHRVTAASQASAGLSAAAVVTRLRLAAPVPVAATARGHVPPLPEDPDLWLLLRTGALE